MKYGKISSFHNSSTGGLCVLWFICVLRVLLHPVLGFAVVVALEKSLRTVVWAFVFGLSRRYKVVDAYTIYLPIAVVRHYLMDNYAKVCQLFYAGLSHNNENMTTVLSHGILRLVERRDMASLTLAQYFLPRQWTSLDYTNPTRPASQSDWIDYVVNFLRKCQTSSLIIHISTMCSRKTILLAPSSPRRASLKLCVSHCKSNFCARTLLKQHKS